MKSSLFGQNLESRSTDLFSLQNERMLRIALEGEIYALQGSMVAYQGQMNFDYKGSGSVAKFLKKALTSEGIPLMKVSGKGDLFLAHQADEVHLVYLENEALTVNGPNILAFEPSLEWDINRLKGASMFAGGLFNTTLTGTGWVALTAYGSPVVLRNDQPTYVDIQAAVAWSSNMAAHVHSTMKAGALIGRGSGESFQLTFEGDGFVIVQASEGRPITTTA
jgi:uncharacterized protein (AIM24 family)